ncbi:hypothetical protein [Gracilibacillus alcaliphilus]|uniref:hypothetical protein n=1 Tax=Gracilibacillus alcaliphilus TaxID=1401441 RepID=UPI00195AC2A1|nr:hypothetical protein [Gracilibacillus alcaliphilus]MBM7675436.1 hypothetical protein [Gracilibacillus alcaliphilus]
MKKWIFLYGALIIMLLLSVIPSLIMYEGISSNIPALPDFESPDWFVPVGFINIALIVVVSYLMARIVSKD